MTNYIFHNGTFYERPNTENELTHYGVLGMKWGVRRGNAAKAYEKASKKLNRLDARADRAMDRAYKKQAKADRKASSVFASQKSAAKADFKAKKAMRKAVVKTRKAQSWLRAMDQTFKGTTESLSKEQIDMGRRYVETMNSRVFR